MKQKKVTKPTLVFFRHGKTAMNAATANGKGELRGWDDPPLTPEGHKEAKATAAHVAQYPLAHIYSSPLTRASQTAHHAAEATGAKVTHTNGLLPWNYGDFTGKYEDEKTLKQLKFYQDRPGITVPGGEKYRNFKDDRYSPTVAKLAQYAHQTAKQGKAVGVSTHSRNLYPLPNILSGGKKPIPIHGGYPPGTVVVVEFNPDGSYSLRKETVNPNAASLSGKLVRQQGRESKAGPGAAKPGNRGNQPVAGRKN